MPALAVEAAGRGGARVLGRLRGGDLSLASCSGLGGLGGRLEMLLDCGDLDMMSEALGIDSARDKTRILSLDTK